MKQNTWKDANISENGKSRLFDNRSFEFWGGGVFTREKYKLRDFAYLPGVYFCYIIQ